MLNKTPIEIIREANEKFIKRMVKDLDETKKLAEDRNKEVEKLRTLLKGLQ